MLTQLEREIIVETSGPEALADVQEFERGRPCIPPDDPDIPSNNDYDPPQDEPVGRLTRTIYTDESLRVAREALAASNAWHAMLIAAPVPWTPGRRQAVANTMAHIATLRRVIDTYLADRESAKE